ncbi:MAG: hypothetical protein ACK5MD_03325 [Flavobacteriales bacterium]
MKTLKKLFILTAFVGFTISCDSDSGGGGELEISAKNLSSYVRFFLSYDSKIVEVTSATPVDYDGDGLASTNILNQMKT